MKSLYDRERREALQEHAHLITPEVISEGDPARILGVIPFEGRDIYRGGRGHMLGKILNLLKVVDAQDPEIAQSALVTLFAEAFLVPSYALQSYITWDEWGEDGDYEYWRGTIQEVRFDVRE